MSSALRGSSAAAAEARSGMLFVAPYLLVFVVLLL